MTRPLKVHLSLSLCALCLTLGASAALAKSASHKAKHPAAPTVKTPRDGIAEARLIDIYRLIGQAETQTALKKAEQLVLDYPTFGLAQLVLGDLLSTRSRPVLGFGDVPTDLIKARHEVLSELKNESQLRLKALRERPPSGSVPAEFLQISPRSKHAIAIDAARARLYLFENRDSGLVLLSDYYISIGKSGLEKKLEGDQRTPLGVYFITSALNQKNLKDFYGSGALPLSYPNVLDLKRGKTGSGIWLHGTPPGQFSRPPLASDGCVVVANPDLERIMRTVEIRSTPVLISAQLKWVPVQSLRPRSQEFTAQLNAWLQAKSNGSVNEVTGFYAADFNNNGKTLADWLPNLRREVASVQGRALEIKDLSLLHWTDANETMVVTFGEVAAGQKTGSIKRQYWSRYGNQWKIFYEGVIG